MKPPTLKQKVKMYEDFLHKLNVGVVCGSSDIIQKLISNADKWSYMHRYGNGELSEKEQQKLINKAFWNLCE